MSIRTPLRVIDASRSCPIHRRLDKFLMTIEADDPQPISAVHDADDRKLVAVRRPARSASGAPSPAASAHGFRAVRVRHHRADRVGPRCAASEDDLGPIRRDSRAAVGGRIGDERTRLIRRRVQSVDVTVGRGVQDVAVRAGTERRRQRFRRPGDQDRGAEREDQAEDDEEPGHPGHLCEADGRLHGEPPFEARPPRPLSCPGRLGRGSRRGSRGCLAQPVPRANRRRSGRSHRGASCETALRDRPPSRSGIGVERRSHGLERSVEARFRRSERDAEHDGDFRQWQVEIVMKDDEGPRLRLETAEAAVELVAVVDRGRHVADQR